MIEGAECDHIGDGAKNELTSLKLKLKIELADVRHGGRCLAAAVEERRRRDGWPWRDRCLARLLTTHYNFQTKRPQL
jgi:hypothetical protein